MNQIYQFFIIGFFLFSCSSKEPVELQKIDPTHADIPLNLSDIGKKLNIIEIKTKTPIGGMPDVILSDKYIYLFDQDHSQSLYQVDYDGNVLNSIRFGNDDKLNINGINNLVAKNNKVGVVSMGSKIIWFDENLKEEKTEIMAIKANYHFPFQNGYVSFVNRINDEIDFDFVASDESAIIHTAIPIDRNEYAYVYKPYSPFAKYNDQILFTKSFNDTIFVYNEKEGLMPFAKVNFGSSSVPDDQFMKIQNAFDMMNFFNAKKFSYLDGEIYSIDDQKALILVSIKGRGKLGLWDIKKGSIVTYPSLKDNFKSNMELFQVSTVSSGKTVFGVSGEYVKNSASESFKNSLKEGYEYSFFLLAIE